MAKNLILIDSCVLIKAFRRDAMANKTLQEIANRTAYSDITRLELLVGANTPAKKEAMNKIFASYYRVPLSPEIADQAMQIMNAYVTGQKVISVPDCLIAATSIVSGFPLLTYNKKDFEFVERISFYK
ncbi:MAG: type II toxin-antitoxin system VapC family toxin [Mangrovibacterium sp.]